jgi:hypothetical protein
VQTHQPGLAVKLVSMTTLEAGRFVLCLPDSCLTPIGPQAKSEVSPPVLIRLVEAWLRWK